MSKTMTLNLSGTQANYVLERLVADRQINASQVRGALAAMQRDIQDLEARLNNLRGAAGRSTTPRPTAAAAAAPTPKAGRRRRKAVFSPETIASRQLQGRYLGLIRQIPETRRAKFKKIAKADGREAAIKALRSVLGK
jgi:hypothetical protein